MEKKVQNRIQGQALMEFVLGLMVVFSFFFFFIRMSALFAIANYIHYATFMAARAYSSGSDLPEERAKEVLDATVSGKFKSLISTKDQPLIGGGPYFQVDSKMDFWNQGVSFPFKAKLTMHPFTPKGQAIEMDLVSESWMPSNPTQAECSQLRSSMASKVVGVTNVVVEWDNGC